MKRFTETNKWRDPWFRRLSSPAKQFWEYLRDNCDQIGLIEVDFSLVSSDCGQKIDESHVAEIGDRLQTIGPSKYFLPKFIHFQYGELTETCPPHRPIISLVKAHKLVRVGLHYAYPTCIEDRYPSGRVALPLRQDKTGPYKTRQEKEGVQGEINGHRIPLREGWKLRKDERELTDRINQEVGSVNPDRDLIAALKIERKGIRDAMKLRI